MQAMCLPIGPSSSSSSGWSWMCLNIGSRKASVFPLPVLAIPIMSRPDMMTGTACAWIGVGFSKSCLQNNKCVRREVGMKHGRAETDLLWERVHNALAATALRPHSDGARTVLASHLDVLQLLPVRVHVWKSDKLSAKKSHCNLQQTTTFFRHAS